MSWYYDFYKIYKTKQEDVTLWNGRQSEDLPDHLRFLCEEYDDNDEHDGFEEIMEDILPINMYVEGKEYQGYLATLYPVAHFGRDAFEVAYKSPRKCWYHFVRLTNSKAKKMIKKAFYASNNWLKRPDECLAGYLGKKNEYKLYPGKLRNIVFYHYQ